MYDPSVGRWLSVDPLGFDAKDVNLYRYVGNSPAATIDPSGLIEYPIEYYTVGGIYEQLGGQLGTEWGIASAHLRQRMTNRSWRLEDKGGCYRATLNVTVEFYLSDIVMTLPEWTDYHLGSPAQQQAWDDMIQALGIHEAGHMAIFEEFMSDEWNHYQTFCWEEAIDKKTAMSEAWAEMQRMLDRAFQRREQELQDAHDAYDDATNRGATQGVTLPQVL